MITAGMYWDREENELLEVSPFDKNEQHFPYVLKHSTRAYGFTGGFRIHSTRADCLVRCDNCNSLEDVQLHYPEFFI